MIDSGSSINPNVTIPENAAPMVLAGRYRVVRQLGQGGMGSVWLAEDTKLDGRKVAIKMLPSILVSNKRAYRQVKDEALVSLKLSHPNIVSVRSFEEDNGNPFLVMDYIDGKTLDDYLADKGKLSEDETVKLLKPIADALDYAHSQGVVHRDVKPGNVMIATDGHPYILDFGIAREVQETMTRVTGKLSSGTLMYMSPEQLHGAAPKPPQDIYSFAALVYECLMGTPPFVRGQIEYQIEHDKPEPLDEHIAICSQVMAGLEKSAAERPPSCKDVLVGQKSVVEKLNAEGRESVRSAMPIQTGVNQGVRLTPAVGVDTGDDFDVDVTMPDPADKRHLSTNKSGNPTDDDGIAKRIERILCQADFRKYRFWVFPKRWGCLCIGVVVLMVSIIIIQKLNFEEVHRWDEMYRDFYDKYEDNALNDGDSHVILRELHLGNYQKTRGKEILKEVRAGRFEHTGHWNTSVAITITLFFGSPIALICCYLTAFLWTRKVNLLFSSGQWEEGRRYKRLIFKEHPALAYWDAVISLFGFAGERNPRQAVDALKKLADGGNGEALFALGLLSSCGYVIAHDDDKAQAYWRKALAKSELAQRFLFKQNDILVFKEDDQSIKNRRVPEDNHENVEKQSLRVVVAGWEIFKSWRTWINIVVVGMFFYVLYFPFYYFLYGHLVDQYAPFLVQISPVYCWLVLPLYYVFCCVFRPLRNKVSNCILKFVFMWHHVFFAFLPFVVVFKAYDVFNAGVKASVLSWCLLIFALEVAMLLWRQGTLLNKLNSFIGDVVCRSKDCGTFGAEGKFRFCLVIAWALVSVYICPGVFFNLINTYPENDIGTMKGVRAGDECELTLPGGAKMVFCYCPAGNFTMGTPKLFDFFRQDPHRVSLTTGFWIGKYEVTQAQWKSVMGSLPSECEDLGDEFPVVKVSWDDCNDFANRVSTRLQMKLRLPTEAEWEYACRSGSTGRGYADLDSIAWMRENSGKHRHQVGLKKPNAWGIHDMIGNVTEWCADYYKEDYGLNPYVSVQVDPKGPSSGEERVCRGAYYDDNRFCSMSSFREWGDRPSERSRWLGARFCFSVTQMPSSRK